MQKIQEAPYTFHNTLFEEQIKICPSSVCGKVYGAFCIYTKLKNQ